jgi:phage shock protein PspC (stress-responsive transcriptional regulator)
MDTTAAPLPTFVRLRRDRTDRYLGGVAGGLGRYFGVDPVLFRILFVALCLFGGSGVGVYVIAWLVVPHEDAEHSILGRTFGAARGRRRVLRNVLVAGVVAAVLLCVTAVGALAAVASSSDVPLRGGVGDRSWSPSTADELHRAYRLGAGDLTLDLSGIEVPEGVTRVDASVVAGHLVVRVPQGTAVGVDAHTGLGEVDVFGERDEGRNAERSVRVDSGRRLVIDARAAVGQVEVLRGAATG